MGERRSRSFYFPRGVFHRLRSLFLYGPMFAIYILSFQGPDGGPDGFRLNGRFPSCGSARSSPASGIVDIGARLLTDRSKLGLVVMILTGF